MTPECEEDDNESTAFANLLNYTRDVCFLLQRRLASSSSHDIHL